MPFNCVQEEHCAVRVTARHLVALIVIGLAGGCLTAPNPQMAPVGGLVFPASQRDYLWERTVSVLNQHHFQIERESKIEGIIETHYRTGSNLFEPWHPDSVGYENRLESTLQSIRRRVVISIQQSADDSLVLSAVVEKEIEDLPGLAANYEGGATFTESDPFDRDLEQVVGQTTASRWVSLGRDTALEQQILNAIRGG